MIPLGLGQGAIRSSDWRIFTYLGPEFVYRGAQDRSVRHDHRALNVVLQLADIPRPMVELEAFHYFIGNVVYILAHAFPKLLDKRPYQQRNVLGTLAQW